MRKWHVYYRTVGMEEGGEKGWRKKEFLADSGLGAAGALMDCTRNVSYLRVYPGEFVLAYKVEWEPTLHLRHTPHEEDQNAPAS